jgi:hypothetical protein
MPVTLRRICDGPYRDFINISSSDCHLCCRVQGVETGSQALKRKYWEIEEQIKGFKRQQALLEEATYILETTKTNNDTL